MTGAHPGPPRGTPHSGPPPEVSAVHWGRLDTDLGPVHVAAVPSGVISVSTAGGEDDGFVSRLEAALGARVRLVAGSSPMRDVALAELSAYFAGGLRAFSVPLDWRLLHGEFNQRVLTALAAVPWGHLISYSELARRVGAPRAARAVGRACGANPLSIIVPCHRVVHAHGGIGGYGGRGIAYKRALLAIEEVTFPTAR